MESNKKTPQEIENLKRNWKNDPCWDIYNTEGFEAHIEELKEYQREDEEKWQKKQASELQEFAIKLGIPDQLTLAQYIKDLEYRLRETNDRIDEMKFKD